MNIPLELVEMISEYLDITSRLNLSSTCHAFRYVKHTDLTDDQLKMLASISYGNNVYVMGSAGVGKSYCIGKMIKRYGARMIVTSTTGYSASLISSSTIDSLIRLLSSKQLIDPPSFDKLVIDEASMLGDKKLRRLDVCLRKYYTSGKIFGGKQLILVGDPLQLPPVLDSHIFYSPYYTSYNLDLVVLRQVVRQQDKEFASALGDIRCGLLSDRAKMLLDEMSCRPPIEGSPIVVGTNIEAKAINNTMQDVISSAERTFDRTFTVEGLIESVEINTTLKKHLKLKIGSSVMLIKNVCVQSGLTNGTRGEVISFDPAGMPVVMFNLPRGNTIIESVGFYLEEQIFRNLIRVDYEDIDRSIRQADKDMLRGYGISKVSIRQIPLMLSWATTVHKVQGCTLDNLQIDCRKIYFHGQLYTAISRVRTKEGISLKNYSKSCLSGDAMLLDQIASIIRYHKQRVVNKRDADLEYESFVAVQSGMFSELF